MEASRNELNAAIENWQLSGVQACIDNKGMFLLDQNGGGIPLKQMTKKQLYAIAKAMSIKGRSKMTHCDLIKAIRNTRREQRKKL